MFFFIIKYFAKIVIKVILIKIVNVIKNKVFIYNLVYIIL